MVEGQAVETAVASILKAIGDDAGREGLRDTPRRVARMYSELFSGVGVDPRSAIDTIFEEERHEEGVVVLRGVPFYSMCEHHLMPFFGQAHMGYVPTSKIAGASKLVRALEVAARRPQIQERLTAQLADAVHDVRDTAGTGVVIEAEHLCMTARGVRKPGSKMVTSAMRGAFRSDANTRAEFLELIRPPR